MLTVHHLETSRSHRVLWLLEELGVPYELKVYRRNPATRLAPPELRAVHPLGKSPVVTTEEGEVIAESGAILEYLAERYGVDSTGELAQLEPARGTPEHRQCRYWMHYAEGSLMNWLVMKLVFLTIPRQPMPFFARAIARKLCANVQQRLVDPNLAAATSFIESHLAQHQWFAGRALTIADFQMSFPLEALTARSTAKPVTPNLDAYLLRVRSRPAWQVAVRKGGPVVISA
jgi:glutathione S-transferase